MQPSTLDAILELSDAITHGDAAATFRRAVELAEILGDQAAAVAIARALAREAGHVATAPPRLVVSIAPGLASCA